MFHLKIASLDLMIYATFILILIYMFKFKCWHKLEFKHKQSCSDELGFSHYIYHMQCSKCGCMKRQKIKY